MSQTDPHPEIGGRTTKCTCHPNMRLMLPGPVANPPEKDGLTAEEAQALIRKEVG